MRYRIVMRKCLFALALSGVQTAAMSDDAYTTARLLDDLLAYKKKTANAAAEEIERRGLGTFSSAQSAMVRIGKGVVPRSQTLRPIGAYFGIDYAAFTSDTAAAACARQLGFLGGAPGGRASTERRVPVVGTAKMGDDGYYEEISPVTGSGDGHIEIATQDKNAYGLRVRGQSMFPAIRDGWYVLIEPNGTPTEGEYVLIRLKDGRKMVKEFLFRRPGTVEVMSVNGGERITIPVEEMFDMQPVGAVVSPSKWHPE